MVRGNFVVQDDNSRCNLSSPLTPCPFDGRSFTILLLKGLRVYVTCDNDKGLTGESVDTDATRRWTSLRENRQGGRLDSNPGMGWSGRSPTRPIYANEVEEIGVPLRRVSSPHFPRVGRPPRLDFVRPELVPRGHGESNLRATV